MNQGIIKLFLRLALGIGFLSAVADRFGLLNSDISAWGNMDSFLSYTQVLMPWMPSSMIPTLGWTATIAELAFGILLIVGYKTNLIAKLSGFLLLSFALTMATTIGIKKVFDFSVLSASAAAFGLSLIKEKYLEIDAFLTNSNN